MSHDLGVEVVYTRLPGKLRGLYDHEVKRIYVESRLSNMNTAATLAHEYVHAQHGHDGHQGSSVECRVDEKAAMLLVSPALYAQAERLHGCHPGALSRELELPRWVVEAWQRVLARSYPASKIKTEPDVA